MTETKASGEKTSVYDPTGQPRLRCATYWAAFIIFITPMIRSGWLETTFDFLIWFRGGPIAFVVLNIIGVFASLLFLSLFLAWTWPRTEPLGLPPRSYWLLGLLLVYLPIQVIYQPQVKTDNALERLREIDEMLPAIPVIRHLDKPILFLLALWALRRGRILAPAERFAFHFLLFFCLIWALCEYINMGFGKSFLD